MNCESDIESVSSSFNTFINDRSGDIGQMYGVVARRGLHLHRSLAERGWYSLLASEIKKDLADLARAPKSCQYYVNQTRQAIYETATQYP